MHLNAGLTARTASSRHRGDTRFAATGRLNTYAVFSELDRSLLTPEGRAGFIVPSGIATDDTTKHFFATLVHSAGLVSLFGFENEEKLFPAVNNQVKFCLMTISGSSIATITPEFVFFARQASALQRPKETLHPDDE